MHKYDKKYRYVGDNVGTTLEKNVSYRFTKVNPNILRGFPLETGFKEIEITKQEFNNHLEIGTLKEV